MGMRLGDDQDETAWVAHLGASAQRAGENPHLGGVGGCVEVIGGAGNCTGEPQG